MITVAILINGNPIMSRSAVNKMRRNDKGETEYRCDDGSTIWHKSDIGAVPLAIAMLKTIDEGRDAPAPKEKKP